MKRQTFALLMLWALTGSCGDGGSDGADDADAIKLGMLAPKSGELAEWGRQMERSAQFAVQDLNQAGGVGGRKLRLIVKDTQAEPETAVLAAQELVDEGVVAIIGPGTSAEAVAVIESVTRAARVPMISPGATSPLLTSLDDDGTFFRTIASDAFQGKVLARRMYEDGARTLSVIYRDDAYGAGLRATVEAEFMELGGELVAAVAYDADKLMNFNSEAAQLFPAGKDPDAVVLLSFHEDGANITRDIRVLGRASLPRFYGVDGVYSDEFAQAGAPEIVDGLVGTGSVAPTDDPNFIDRRAAFAELTGVASDFDGGSYDAVCLATLAFAAAGEASREAVIEHLREVTRAEGDGAQVVNPREWKQAFAAASAGTDIDYNGASGPTDLDEAGDVSHGYFVFWKIGVDGSDVAIEEEAEAVAFP